MANLKQFADTLSSEKRTSLPDFTYAFPEERKEPLNNASPVRNAIARFDQVTGVSALGKKAAFTKIKTVAKKIRRRYDLHFSR